MATIREKKADHSASKRPGWTLPKGYAWLVAGSYCLIILALFHDFVFSDLMIYGSDTMQAQVYFKNFYIEALRSGTFPVWTPYLFGGMPYVDAFHSDIFYPVTFPFKFLLPLHRALGWTLLVHFWIGGMGMYFAARSGWRLNQVSATLAGLCYMLAPYFVSMVHPGHDGKIFVTAIFPIGFLFLKRIWDHAQLRDAALFALVLGNMFLTPHVQMGYFAMWAYCAYSVYRIVSSLRSTATMPWKASIGALLAVVVAMAISAIQFYPGFHYVNNHSPRSGEGRGFEYATSWSLHPEEIVSEVIPEFAGVSDKSSNTYWGRNVFKDNTEYGGLVALILAVFAVWRTRFKDRWFFFGLGALATLYALGAHTPLFTLFYHVVPNVSKLRAPSMIMFLYVFSIALCAGSAVNSLMSRDTTETVGQSSTKLLWIISGVLGGLALIISVAPAGVMSFYTSVVYSDITPQKFAVLTRHYDTIVAGFWLAAFLAGAVAYFSYETWRRCAIWALAGLAILVILDTTRMDRRFIKMVDLELFFPHDPVVDFIKSQPQPTRVLAWPGGFRTNYFALKNIPEMAGYHGNQLRTYNAFLGGSTQPRLYSRRAMDLAHVEYLIFRRGANLTQELTDPTIEKVYDKQNVVVYRNLNALPRVRLVTCWERHEPTDSLYDRLFAPDFDERQCALVESDLPFFSHTDSLGAGQAAITEYEMDYIDIDVQAHDSSLLILSDNYYPAWGATLDGEPVTVLKTNATFRGVIVPPGTHTVRFEYHSPRLIAGAWISIFATLLAGLVVVGDTWWRRTRKP